MTSSVGFWALASVLFCAAAVGSGTSRANAQGLDGGVITEASSLDSGVGWTLHAADAANAPPVVPVVPLLAPAVDLAAARTTLDGTPMLSPAADDAPVDVTVRALSVADRMQQSSEAVQVVDLAVNRRQAADLGEVLARTQGISVRRSGGLGSGERIALNGFGEDQVRVFVDGLPIEYTGFGTGLSNLPVNLLERVEIYRGVVPIRFGADALGGAINVVTKLPTRGKGANASLLVGAFGTHRLTLGAHHLHAPTGLITRVQAFFDDAQNDYPVRVGVPNAEGGTSNMSVYRRHDAYRAFGGGVDVGFVRRPWAEKLLLKLFASNFDKQIPHNLVMTAPYGDARWDRQNYGANLQYAQPLGDHVRLEALVGYGLQATDFVDKGEWLYDWFGQRVTKLTRPGEIDGKVYDTTLYEHGLFGRAHLSWQLSDAQTLRLSMAPNFITRSGTDHAAREIDLLSAEARMSTVVTGIEHELDLFDERLENTLFFKSYYYRARFDEPLDSGRSRRRERSDPYFGAGDALRFRVLDWLYAKASYEYAIRTPRSDELFGDGALIFANLDLQPERSHNVNLGVSLAKADTAYGSFKLDVNAFDRHADKLIARFGSDRVQIYQNVGKARSVGAEVVGSYTSRKDYLGVGGNFTYQDFRNTSTSGADASTKGDRVPNQPYLFANASVRGSLPGVLVASDSLSLTYYLRYVHQFYRSWESLGVRQFKQTVDTQVSHTLSLTYLVKRDGRTLSASLDAQNLTNARIYDVFGAQRPGRAYFTKLTADF